MSGKEEFMLDIIRCLRFIAHNILGVEPNPFIHLFMDICNVSVIITVYIALNKRVMYRRHYSDYARALGLEPGSGKLFYSRTFRTSLRPNCTAGIGVIFPGIKRPGPYIYSSSSGDEVKNKSSCASVSPIRLHGLMRDDFTCEFDVCWTVHHCDN